MTQVKITKTAKKYADALFETAQKQNLVEKVFADLSLIAETLGQSQDLFSFLDSMVVSSEDKKDVVQKVFGDNIENITKNFLYLLSDNSRYEILNEIIEEYKNIFNEANRITSVRAVTAVDMKDYLKEKLKQKLENKLQKQVVIDYEVDSSIIAGLVLEVDGKTIDTSVQTKLNNIKKQII